MNPLLMFWHIQKAAVNTFARFSIEISLVLESAGGCCESIINVLESPEGCCEDLCTFFQMKYLWFWNQQEVGISRRLR